MLAAVQEARDCRLCGALLEPALVDLGPQPLANNLEPTEEAALAAPRYPMALTRCSAAGCGSVQLTHTVDPRVLFERYLFTPDASAAFKAHLRGLADALVAGGAPRRVLEIGGNSGLLLCLLQEAGAQVLNVDPAENLLAAGAEAGAAGLVGRTAAHGVPTLARFWDETAADYVQAHGPLPDLVVATNVCAHTADLRGFVGQVARVLRPGGRFVFEVYDLLAAVETGAWDLCCYHEHVFTHHLWPLWRLLAEHGLKVLDVERVSAHGGSLRVTAGATGTMQMRAVDRLEAEKAAGLTGRAVLEAWGQRAAAGAAELREVLEGLRAAGKRVVGWTAPAKATVLMNAAGIGRDLCERVVEDAPLKQGKWIPGVGVPVVAPADLGDPPDVVVWWAWNVVADAAQRVPAGVRVLVPAPTPRFLG